MRLISMKCLISGISKIIVNFMNSTCSLIGKMRLVAILYFDKNTLDLKIELIDEFENKLF